MSTTTEINLGGLPWQPSPRPNFSWGIDVPLPPPHIYYPTWLTPEWVLSQPIGAPLPGVLFQIPEGPPLPGVNAFFWRDPGPIYFGNSWTWECNIDGNCGGPVIEATSLVAPSVGFVALDAPKGTETPEPGTMALLLLSMMLFLVARTFKNREQIT